MNNYYPFGLMRDNPDAMPNATYQGKEFQTNTFSDGSELALYDFGARMYDPVLGRWHCSDPMYQFDSPYNAMANNPVVNIDPDGMWSIPWGNIVSSIGGYIAAIKETATKLIGYADFVNGKTQPVYSSSTTQPLSGLGTAVGGAAMLLQAGLDGKKIQDAAREMGKGVTSNQGSLQPPQTQQQFDQRYYQDYKFRVDTEIRNEYSSLTPNASNPTSYPTKQEVVDMLNKSLVDPKLYLKEVDPATNDIVAGFEYRVVEYEIYEYDVSKGDPNDPTFEVPGSFQNVILVDPANRSDDPLFQRPTKNSSNKLRDRMMEFNFYDPFHTTNRRGYRISFKFQLVRLG
jgi:RHS repeat-associated protein